MLATGAGRELVKSEEFAPAHGASSVDARSDAQALIEMVSCLRTILTISVRAARAVRAQRVSKPASSISSMVSPISVRWFAEDGRETLALKRRAGKKLR